MELDVEQYAKVDPDKIYVNDDKSITFVYNKLLSKDFYPYTHDDLLIDPDCFYDTFPNAVDIITKDKIEDFISYIMRTPIDSEMNANLRKMGILPMDFRTILSTREKALQFGKALLGRIGLFGGDIVIALWQQKSHPLFLKFLNDPRLLNLILRTYGAKYKPSEWLVKPYEEPIKYFSDYVDIPELLKKITTPEKGEERKQSIFQKEYEIGGSQIPFDVLKDFRAKLHSAPQGSKEYMLSLSVLCHQDMEKYPELSGFIPTNKCDKKVSKDLNLPPTITPRQIVGRELYGKNKNTGLLYPAWKATSEGNFSFQNWIEKNA